MRNRASVLCPRSLRLRELGAQHVISHFEDMPAQLAALGIAEQGHLHKAHALLEQGSVIGKVVLKDFE